MFCFDSNYLFYEEMYINQILLRMGAGYGKIPKILNTFSYRFFFFFFFFFFCFFLFFFLFFITQTFLYNFDHLKPHFYFLNSKTGVYRGTHYFSYFCSIT